jgi:hypothetical protein
MINEELSVKVSNFELPRCGLRPMAERETAVSRRKTKSLLRHFPRDGLLVRINVVDPCG